MTAVGSSKQSCPFKKEQESQAQKDEKHWIKFVLENEFSEPVPNVKVKITLPNSDKVIEKTSDSSGKVEIADVEPGSYKIESDWCSDSNK